MDKTLTEQKIQRVLGKFIPGRIRNWRHNWRGLALGR